MTSSPSLGVPSSSPLPRSEPGSPMMDDLATSFPSHVVLSQLHFALSTLATGAPLPLAPITNPASSQWQLLNHHQVLPVCLQLLHWAFSLSSHLMLFSLYSSRLGSFSSHLGHLIFFVSCWFSCHLVLVVASWWSHVGVVLIHMSSWFPFLDLLWLFERMVWDLGGSSMYQ
ncbi:hypothetical protein BDQ17DRAFT_883610 [Cyathus striatus]|nr:hypothetical protein BDQ17DRAFT_883610 [Cyathus striatus]